MSTDSCLPSDANLPPPVAPRGWLAVPQQRGPLLITPALAPLPGTKAHGAAGGAVAAAAAGTKADKG